MINNQQRVPTTGSNQSQQGLEQSKSTKNDRKQSSFNTFPQCIKVYFIDAVIFTSCIFFGWIVAQNLFGKNYSSFDSEITGPQILENKGFRGYFPSLMGNKQSLQTKWKIDLVTFQTASISQYNGYILHFKQNGQMHLSHQKCEGALRFSWLVLYYNIYIEQIDQKDDQMVIPNQEKDIKCIKGNESIMIILKNSSVWTVNNKNLYIISQLYRDSNVQNIMLILSRIQP